jgi:hypothetical protein
MSTLIEIEAATEALPQEQKAELLRFLAARLRSERLSSQKTRLVRHGGDTLLEAPPGAPAMTPENVRHMLEDWP